MVGSTFNHIAPARVEPATVTPVPIALKRCAPVYTTWFMRVSLESSEDKCSFLAGLLWRINAQHPRPGPTREPLSLRHSASGIGPLFCCASGGRVYVPAVIS